MSDGSNVSIHVLVLDSHEGPLRFGVDWLSARDRLMKTIPR